MYASRKLKLVPLGEFVFEGQKVEMYWKETIFVSPTHYHFLPRRVYISLHTFTQIHQHVTRNHMTPRL